MTVERSIWINGPRERVWQAITQAEQIQRWWGNDHWEIGKLEVGGIIKFGDPKDLMTAKVAVVDPPRQFSIEWPPQPQYHGILAYTIYLLEEQNGGTLVTVRETGLEALPDDVRQQQIERTESGYTTVLANLKTYLEGG